MNAQTQCYDCFSFFLCSLTYFQMMVVTAINIASVVAVLPYSYHMQVSVCSNPHSMPLVLKSVQSIKYNSWLKGKRLF